MKLSKELESALQGKQLLIFDFDGTLADTSPLHAKAFEETLSSQGIPVNYESIAGRKTADAILLCYSDAGLPPPDSKTLEALVAAKQSRVRALIQSELQPLPGVEEFLRWVKPRFQLALVTSGSRATVELALKKLGFQDYFPVAVFAEDVGRGKPDPEGFSLVLSTTEVPVSEAIIFEDSETGYLAASAVGAACIDLSSFCKPHTRGN
jgi:HAD superfamily hydrolase (TIGR01509 family)